MICAVLSGTRGSAPVQPTVTSEGRTKLNPEGNRRWTVDRSARANRAKGNTVRQDFEEGGDEPREVLYGRWIQHHVDEVKDELDGIEYSLHGSCVRADDGVYWATIQCSHGCFIGPIRMCEFKIYVGHHKNVCTRDNAVARRLRKTMEASGLTGNAVSKALLIVNDEEKYKAFESFEDDAALLRSFYPDISELPEKVGRLNKDERFGSRGQAILDIVKRLSGRRAKNPHFSWYIPKYHKIWTEYGFPDPLQKKKPAEKSAKRQKSRR